MCTGPTRASTRATSWVRTSSTSACANRPRRCCECRTRRRILTHHRSYRVVPCSPVLLCNGGHDSCGWQRLYVCLRNLGRADRVDHRLESHSPILGRCCDNQRRLVWLRRRVHSQHHGMGVLRALAERAHNLERGDPLVCAHRCVLQSTRHGRDTFRHRVIFVVGIQQSARFNAAVVFPKVTVVLLIIAFAWPHTNTANWHPFIPENTGAFGKFGISGIFQGATMVFFSYIGSCAICAFASDT